MRNFKKRTIALCLASAITVLGSFAADSYQNSLMSLRIDSGSNGSVSFTAFTKKPFQQTIRTEKIDNNTFYVILPETNSEVSSMPMINGYDNIDSMRISTYPYSQGVEGYTRIEIRTKGEPIVSATTSLYIPARTQETSPYAEVLSIQNKKNEEKPVVEAQPKTSSYWDQHNEPAAQKTEEKKPAGTKSSSSTKSFKQKNAQSPDFNSNYPTDMPSSGSNERLPIFIGFVAIVLLIAFFIFLRRDQMAGIVGDQKDLDFDDDDKHKKTKSKSKAKKIRGTINKLDDTYKNTQTTGKINIVTGAEIKEEEPVVEKTFEDEPEEQSVIVDLDSLYNEKTKAMNVEPETTSEESDVDDLADFLSEFSFEEEEQQPPQEENFDEELYENTISNEKINFSKNDSQRLNQLLQNEISDETLNNIDEFAPKTPVEPKVPTEMEVLENVLAEYTIKQNISFSKDDVDTIRKLIKVELDDEFINDLRTNPQRTEAMKQELENKEKKPHKTSEMLILNVKDLLPDLSKEMQKQGNKRIESEQKHDVVYYSEGYEVSKLTVTADLANMSKAIHDTDANKFRPSDDLPIVESGYDVETLSIKDALPSIEDYKKHPNKYEKKKVVEDVDEEALLNSIANVQFKPFYDNVQEEMNHFDGFEIVNKEQEEKMADEQLYKELNKLNDEAKKRAVKNTETAKVKDDAQKLLDKIEEQKIQNEVKKQVEDKPKVEEKPKIESESVPAACEIEGISYKFIKMVKCANNVSCCLAKNDKGYFVIGRMGEEYKILKQYSELKTENIQARVNETKPDGSVQYLIRAGVHKFIVNMTQNSMEFVMDLC